MDVMLSRGAKKKRMRCRSEIETSQHSILTLKRMLLLLLISGPVAVALSPNGPNLNYGALDIVSLAGLSCGVLFAPAYGDNLLESLDPFSPVINRHNGLTRRFSGCTFDFTVAAIVQTHS